jgi:ADP-ribose pyrophosphatase YjhB (NUDIX family)
MNLSSELLDDRQRMMLRAMSASIIGATPGLGALLWNVLASLVITDPGKINIWVVFVAALLGALGGVYRFLWHNLPRSAALQQDCTKDELIRIVASFQNEELKTRGPGSLPIDAPPARSHQPLALLFSEMGVVRSDGNKPVAVSEVADAFLCSLLAHLRGGNSTFMGEWKAGANSSERLKLVAAIRSIEEHRKETAPSGHLLPARRVRSGLALIRYDIGGVPHFLMLKNNQWNDQGAWWFVGGTEELADGGDLHVTVRREIGEEAKLEESDVVDVRLLLEAVDRDFSKRLGLFSEFDFSVFAVQLRQTSDRVKKLFTKDPVVELDYGGAIRKHEFTWMKWEDLVQNPHLIANTPKLLEALKAHVKPSDIPPSFAE